MDGKVVSARLASRKKSPRTGSRTATDHVHVQNHVKECRTAGKIKLGDGSEIVTDETGATDTTHMQLRAEERGTSATDITGGTAGGTGRRCFLSYTGNGVPAAAIDRHK